MNDIPTDSSLRILIVEDEFIIGDLIARRLAKLHHRVVGHAFSYDEALQLYQRGRPDLVLLDIGLRGVKSGIDLAHVLRQQDPPVPHIYLSSQVDPQTLAKARETFPAGYLSKPVQMKSLLATIDIAMYNYRATRSVPTVTVRDGRDTHILICSTITHVRADHVYVKIHLQDRSPIVCRLTLTELLADLPPLSFVQTHRSYIVNLDHITRYDRECVYIGQVGVPVSRGRRQAVFSLL